MDANLVVICVSLVLIAGFYLLGTCQHKWVKQYLIRVFEEGDDEMPIYRKHVCLCEKCGATKIFKV